MSEDYHPIIIVDPLYLYHRSSITPGDQIKHDLSKEEANKLEKRFLEILDRMRELWKENKNQYNDDEYNSLCKEYYEVYKKLKNDNLIYEVR